MKITTTYRPSALFLLAALLFALIGKEAHHLVCHHDHGEQLLCHADKGETHLHDINYSTASCALCLIHIPPSEMPEATWQPKTLLPFSSHILPFSIFQYHSSVERLLPARAPPFLTA